MEQPAADPRKRNGKQKRLLGCGRSGTALIGGAGWSSPVARQAHNLKVVGSNPTPATKHETGLVPVFLFGLDERTEWKLVQPQRRSRGDHGRSTLKPTPATKDSVETSPHRAGFFVGFDDCPD
jgi:hypothetical protein